MKENIKKEVTEFLTNKMLDNINILVRYYFVELSGNKEAKKTAMAARFMEDMLSGGKFVNRDATFIEKNMKLFTKIQDYSNEIKKLTNT